MGLKNDALLARCKRIMLPSTVNPAFPPLVSGKGIYVYDNDGKPYIDMNSQVGIASIGHRNPTVMQAIRGYLEDKINIGTNFAPDLRGGLMAIIGSDYVHELEVELCEKLAEITPGRGEKKVWLDVGGAQAVSSAVHFLQHVREDRPFFISFYGSFHGRDDAALQLTCSKYPQKGHMPRSGNFLKAPFIDVDYIRNYIIGSECHGNQINAVVIEPVQGEGGIEPADPIAVVKLKELCDEFDIKIVADEIQTGLGRTGKMWACMHYPKLEPDILVTSKSLGSGLPIAAFIVNTFYFISEDMSAINKLSNGWDSLTFMGPPLSCVAALATIKAIVDGNLVENAYARGEQMDCRLRHIVNKARKMGYNLKHRGLGLMQGLEFRTPDNQPDAKNRDLFVERALDNGLLFMGAGRGKPEENPTVRVMPPMCITEAEINMVMDKVEQTLFYSHP